MEVMAKLKHCRVIFMLEPTFALLVGVGCVCMCVCLQPRRISAVSVAERVAEERCEILGETAGYSVRFESVLPRHYASIFFCTVGKTNSSLVV